MFSIVLLVVLSVTLGSSQGSHLHSTLPQKIAVRAQLALTDFGAAATKGEHEIVGRVIFATYDVSKHEQITSIFALFSKGFSGELQDYQFKVRTGDHTNIDLTPYLRYLSQSQGSGSGSHSDTKSHEKEPVFKFIMKIPSDVLSIPDFATNDYYLVIKYKHKVIGEELIQVALTGTK